MLYIFRLIITVIYSILVCVFGSIYCLFSPRNPKHVATFGHMFGRLAPLFGLKVECRKPADAENYGNAIYIANHQNNYDMVTASNIVQPPTVTVGKKSLLWIPFFGQLYWLTGNLLIDRNNRTKAHGTIAEVVNHFKKRRISIWMFPEGTRSRGRGLLPFKTGAFSYRCGCPDGNRHAHVVHCHARTSHNRRYPGRHPGRVPARCTAVVAPASDCQ